MLRSSFIISILLSNLISDNQIIIKATVASHANIQTKMTHVDSAIVREDIYLQTNHEGFTIALSNNSYGTSTLMNYRPIGVAPINFSDKIYNKSTRVGELIIS